MIHTEHDLGVDSETTYLKIQTMSTTRWTVRAQCFDKILQNYDLLGKVWTESLLEKRLETELKSRIIGVQRQMMKFYFFFGLYASKKLYAMTDNLSRALQGRRLSAIEGKRKVGNVIQTMKSIRNEESLNALW